MLSLSVRYARMRRRLLVDPPKDGSSSPDLAMDNPLSQNPGKVYHLACFSCLSVVVLLSDISFLNATLFDGLH